MITAETVSSIRHFDSGGLPVVSLYARVDPGPDGQREVHTRVSSLLDDSPAGEGRHRRARVADVPAR